MRKILAKYLLVWLTLTCVLSFFWTRIPGTDRIPDPFDLNGSEMKLLISLAMLVIGSLLPLDEVKMVAKRWPLIIAGTAIQFTAMPLLAFAAAKIFHIEDPYYTGLILAGAVPGAMASNLLTMLAGGNTSYSVGLTTSATLFSPLTIPLLLRLLLGADVSPDVAPMMLDLLITVVMPVVIGFTLSRLFSIWNRCAQAIGEVVGNIVIIWIISAVVAVNRGGFGTNILFLIPPLIFLNLGGYTAGMIGGKTIGLDSRMCRALLLEIGMQNAGLGATIARNYFEDKPGAALCCALYTFGCMFTGILVAQSFRLADYRRAKRAENAVAPPAPPQKNGEPRDQES
ncbi:MAG: bile acid:sodium symporter family protein [Thermoguttaceae bacterium]|nr:bile acid:sodium symporter family protein [Thermoguttaceae bacterium]